MELFSIGRISVTAGRNVEQAVRLIGSGTIPATALISRVLPIGRADEAFAALRRGGVVKVLIDCAADGDD